MQYKKLIQSDIDFNRTFRFITQAYEEIAVLKMRKVRSSVLSTRVYLSRLSEVFFELRRAKEKQRSLLKVATGSKDNLEKITTSSLQPKNSKLAKKVSVLLSANTSLYGDLLNRIFDLFLKNVKKDNSDIIIVGRVGKRLYDQQENKKPYIYFEIPDVEIRLEDLKPVIFHLVKYEQVQVYYGKFESILNQREITSNISGVNPTGFREELIPKMDDSTKTTKKNDEVRTEVGEYLFEPDLNKILRVFEDLIASSLFRQTVHETQLARWASRIMSMEKAQTNIDLSIKKLHFSRSKIIKQEENSRQINRLAGLSLWRR